MLKRLLPLALLAGLSLLAVKAQAPAPLDGGDPIPVCAPKTCPPGQ